jgi:hypothetical protein
MEYLEAFLDLNSPSWYIDADSSNANSNSVYIYVENQTLKFYTEDDNGEMASYEINLVERKSKSKTLLKFYQKFASYELVEDIPIVNLLFSEALPIWLMLACMALCIIKKQKNKLIVFIPALLLWLTYLLGPLSCMRYVLPMYALYPLFMGMAISPDITEADENISTLQGE